MQLGLAPECCDSLNNDFPKAKKTENFTSLAFSWFSIVVGIFCRSRRANTGLHPPIASMIRVHDFRTAVVVQGKERTKTARLNKLTSPRLMSSSDLKCPHLCATVETSVAHTQIQSSGVRSELRVSSKHFCVPSEASLLGFAPRQPLRTPPPSPTGED